MDCGFTEFAVPEPELRQLDNHMVSSGRNTCVENEGISTSSSFVANSAFRSSEIEACECAADKSLALQHGFYRH